jgi:hypothetical protein
MQAIRNPTGSSPSYCAMQDWFEGFRYWSRFHWAFLYQIVKGAGFSRLSFGEIPERLSLTFEGDQEN